MKEFITWKKLKQSYNYIINLSSYTFNYPESPDKYHSGVYGWDCDIYSFYHKDYGSIAIITGYRTDRSGGITPKFLDKIIQEYDSCYSLWKDGIWCLHEFNEYFYNDFIPQLLAGI